MAHLLSADRQTKRITFFTVEATKGWYGIKTVQKIDTVYKSAQHLAINILLRNGRQIYRELRLEAFFRTTVTAHLLLCTPVASPLQIFPSSDMAETRHALLFLLGFIIAPPIEDHRAWSYRGSVCTHLRQFYPNLPPQPYFRLILNEAEGS